MRYEDFLNTKRFNTSPIGIEVDKNLINPLLFPFQRDITHWAIKKGRAAIFLDTGLGKTYCQLEWARLISSKTLIVAPLSIARQTARMAKNIGIDVKYVRSQSEVGQDQIYITNYEMVDKFSPSEFDAVVLDESSILKSFAGKTRKLITAMFSNTRYRLCCTATPAPNDYIELGNHAEFLGICTEAEMKAMFFINANKEHTTITDDGKIFKRKGSNNGGQEWRLKHHAEESFFQWLSSWAFSLTKPSDLGYDDNDFALPNLNIKPVYVDFDYVPDDRLFFTGLAGIADRTAIRHKTINTKLSMLGEIINENEQWIIWCGLDDESTAATKALPDSIEVTGSQSPDDKAIAFERFQDGDIRILITKPKIGGFGMNFQNAHNMIFFGLNDSWETFYQAVRRQYRYGQLKEVNVYIIISTQEEEIYRNIMRKDAQATRLRRGLIEHLKNYEMSEIAMIETESQTEYNKDKVIGLNYTAMLGDSVERLKEIADNSIDLSVYSPPFVDLFTYSNTPRDIGNSRNSNEFFRHYDFIIRDVMRITKPGRLSCVHTSDIPAMASRDGYIGMKDFPGDVINAHEAAGWVFVGRAFVQKNPQAQAIRVKSKALLFVQMRKDSADSRPAIIDQILIFKKPGENTRPIMPVENGEMDNNTWIEWAHGIWLGIRETDTLQYHTARDENDEKHVCPLQLGTIERCIKLYSNPGETVLTPFMGIGSEAYQAIKLRRKAIGIELKESYYRIAVKNLEKAEAEVDELPLFA
jgi:DNA modification methylase